MTTPAMSFVEVMAVWAAERVNASHEGLKVVFRAGVADVTRRSSDVALETSRALGYAAVWGSGEYEAEVVDIQTAERLFVRSLVLASAEDLRHALDEVRGVVLQNPG